MVSRLDQGINLTYSHAADIDRFMSRPWRIEFSGALYHVLSRGNEQGNLFGLSCSSVSKRAGIVRKRLRDDKILKDEFDRLNALIKA